jgi:hypothetical protein
VWRTSIRRVNAHGKLRQAQSCDRSGVSSRGRDFKIISVRNVDKPHDCLLAPFVQSFISSPHAQNCAAVAAKTVLRFDAGIHRAHVVTTMCARRERKSVSPALGNMSVATCGQALVLLLRTPENGGRSGGCRPSSGLRILGRGFLSAPGTVVPLPIDSYRGPCTDGGIRHSGNMTDCNKPPANATGGAHQFLGTDPIKRIGPRLTSTGALLHVAAACHRQCLQRRLQAPL